MSGTIPRLKMCKKCSKLAITYNGFCEDHGRRRHLQNYSARPMPSSKIKNPFGVEIECKATDSRQKLVMVERYACYDASIQYDNGVEFKLCGADSTIANRAADTAQRARLAGGTVDRKCGMHVHMSLPKVHTALNGTRITSTMDNYTVDKLWPVVKALEPTFMSIIPNTRRNSEYCQHLNRKSDFTSHYSWICASSTVPTIELRAHPGTLNPWKVKAWLEVCKGLQSVTNSVILDQDNPNIQKCIDGNFEEIFPAGSLARKYLQERKAANGSLTKFGF